MRRVNWSNRTNSLLDHIEKHVYGQRVPCDERDDYERELEKRFWEDELNCCVNKNESYSSYCSLSSYDKTNSNASQNYQNYANSIISSPSRYYFVSNGTKHSMNFCNIKGAETCVWKISDTNEFYIKTCFYRQIPISSRIIEIAEMEAALPSCHLSFEETSRIRTNDRALNNAIKMHWIYKNNYEEDLVHEIGLLSYSSFSPIHCKKSKDAYCCLYFLHSYLNNLINDDDKYYSKQDINNSFGGLLQITARLFEDKRINNKSDFNFDVYFQRYSLLKDFILNNTNNTSLDKYSLNETINKFKIYALILAACSAEKLDVDFLDDDLFNDMVCIIQNNLQ